MVADVYTKVFTDQARWEHALLLANILDGEAIDVSVANFVEQIAESEKRFAKPPKDEGEPDAASAVVDSSLPGGASLAIETRPDGKHVTVVSTGGMILQTTEIPSHVWTQKQQR